MFRSIVNLTICIVLFGCVLSSQAQQAPQVPRTPRAAAATASPDDTSCLFNFHSGSGNTFLAFCVTATGNIAEIIAPAGHDLLNTGVGTDGYGICDGNSVTSYFDYGVVDGDSGNWGSATVLSSTSKSVKIARSTNDGIWTLTQTISLVPAMPSVKVVMALKNNTAVSRAAALLRYADVNVDTNVTGNFNSNFSATSNTAAGWTASDPISGTPGFGLLLENVGNAPFSFVNGYARTTFHGPSPCAFAQDSSGTPLVDTDGSIALVYNDSVGPKQTKTATMIYKGF
jgi:hypothetical protein